MNILDRLSEYSRKRVEAARRTLPFEEVRARAEALPKGDFRFEKALQGEELALIAEVKKASPSKGIIDETFDYMQIARDYEAAGVDAISCLTEPKWFLGSNEIFQEIRREVDVPMLRKDFTVDPYQIYEAKTLGADAVLIIVSILDQDAGRLKDYLAMCEALGLAALVETHNEAEIELGLNCGARIIGVNNRDLKDFSVNFDNAKDLRRQVPEDVIYIAESGVKAPEDVATIAQMGADATLVGEALMRSEDISASVAAFRQAGRVHGN